MLSGAAGCPFVFTLLPVAVARATGLQVCSQVFGSATGLVDMVVAHVPSSKVATAAKVARLYTGPQDPNSALVQFMTTCSRTGEFNSTELLCCHLLLKGTLVSH
jgi:hypothetical protein